jgi:adenylylsulfate kinase
MASTRLRSLIKGICWEVIAFIITAIAVYLVYGNLFSSIKFAAILTAIKIVFFFVHERLWKKIRWGKYHIIKGKRIKG